MVWLWRRSMNQQELGRKAKSVVCGWSVVFASANQTIPRVPLTAPHSDRVDSAVYGYEIVDVCI